MPWSEVFVVFLVSHLAGDYLLQTEFQALNKRGGLSGTLIQRRALVTHVLTYTLVFVPALIWVSNSLGAGGTIGVAALIAISAISPVNSGGTGQDRNGRRSVRRRPIAAASPASTSPSTCGASSTVAR